MPKGEDNIVVRAAKVFFEETKITSGLSIVLKKKIPHGAGLGGGSSDAASTLLALNELFETNLPREALAKMAEMIGSDVPFFIFQSAAVCKGRGELVSPTKIAPTIADLAVETCFGVPTAVGILALARLARNSRRFVRSPQTFDGQIFVNDLERPVFEKFVFLAHLKMWLLKQADVGAALMSGSGSTVFAVLRIKCEMPIFSRNAQKPNSIRSCGPVRAKRGSEFWGAHASRVLASASCDRELFFEIINAAAGR